MQTFNSSFAVVFTVLAFVLVSCAGSGGSVGDRSSSPNANAVRFDNSLIDLTDYLTQFPGLIVRGTGPNAVIRARGINTINSGTTPLFIMNGFRMGRNYADVYARVNMREVRSVRVLKGAAAGIYGVAGAHGVIVIETGVSTGNSGF